MFSALLLSAASVSHFTLYDLQIPDLNYPNHPLFTSVTLVQLNQEPRLVFLGYVHADIGGSVSKPVTMTCALKAERPTRASVQGVLDCRGSMVNQPYWTEDWQRLGNLKDVPACAAVQALPVTDPSQQNRLPLETEGLYPSVETRDRFGVFYQQGAICHYDGKQQHYIKRMDEEVIAYCRARPLKTGALTGSSAHAKTNEQCVEIAKDRHFDYDRNSYLLTKDFQPVILYVSTATKHLYHPVFTLALPDGFLNPANAEPARCNFGKSCI